jgi:hypothetical protein
MDLSSYFKIAVYFCLIMIIFTLCVNFVSALNIFPTTPSGVDVTGTDPADIFTQISGFSGGMQYLWLTLLSATGILTLAIAKVVGSTNIIGVYLFSAVFWTSFNRCMTVIHIGNWIPLDFLAIFIVAITFIWVAAIISMFTGVS